MKFFHTQEHLYAKFHSTKKLLAITGKQKETRMKFILTFAFMAFICNVLSAQSTKAPNGIKYTGDNRTTVIQFINDQTVRIFKYQGTTAPSKKSLIVLDHKNEGIKTSVRETKNAVTVKSGKLKAELNKTTGLISFYDNKGFRLLAETNDSITDISQSFRLLPDEAVYGLGQHQNGAMNQREQTILLKQRNMDIAIPFLQSTNGYGIYWDNYSATIYRAIDHEMRLTSEAGNCIDYYFIAGKNADEIIDGYRKLTGTAPMFPLWSFGYIQSRERYQSQQQVVDVVRQYRELQVPIDVVVQDWQYWGTNNLNWNAVEFNNPNYANPDAMIDSVHQMNAKILISVWPSFGSRSAIYKELDAQKMLFDFMTYPETDSVKVFDVFNPDARDIYWKYMNKNLFAKGIDGWWLDATEPEQKSKPSEADPFKTNLVSSTTTFLGNYKDYTNAFPFETVNGVYEHQRNTTQDKRVFILTRSAFAGQQRAASMVWSGDVASSWKTLKDQIPAALNYTLSGMPYWNADIGGFFSSRNYPKGNKDLLYQELYIRWLQFGLFTGMMRSHGTDTPREIYRFGKPGDVAFDVIKEYIGLRYRLQPYIYSTAWAITSENGSLMRPLVMDYPQDKVARDLGSEYLFGNSILVAPVTDSIFAKGVLALDSVSTISQNIYLPRGDWYSFDTGEKIPGGQWVQQSFTLNQMPIFIKAGTILPLANEAQYSSIQNFQTLNIRVYPGKDGSFELYEDEGDNYNYEQGKYSTIKFSWDDKNRTLTIDDRKGSFEGMPQNHLFNIQVMGTMNKKAIRYNGTKMIIRLY